MHLSAGSCAETACLPLQVEFGRSFKVVLKTHKKALLSMRRFWQLLLRYDVKSAIIMQSFEKIQSTQYMVSNVNAVPQLQPHAGSTSSPC